MNHVKFVIKQYIKMFFQHIFLPAFYNAGRIKPVKKGYVILADAHHDSLPFSMTALRRELNEYPDLEVKEMFYDFGKHGMVDNTIFMVKFMMEYARAGVLVLCDDFLPAAACRKRKGTKVIQLWHACGAFKKFGADSDQDIPSFYKGSVTSNWNMVTVSSPQCVQPFAGAFELPAKRIRPVGISRTDEYYNEDFNAMCRNKFFASTPQARGKKIVLWAPTFRGNASVAGVVGLEEIQKAAELLKDDYYFIIKLHPHSEKKVNATNCSMPTEELLGLADILITDYSSVLFDAMVYELPLILFTPDFDQYDDGRGFYLNYDSIPGVNAQNFDELMAALESRKTIEKARSRRYRSFYEMYMSGCDGHATERIMQQILSWTR